ncbi:MAG: HPr(Ser) kinase/phosphatase [Terrimicrobiaceae bacterium]|jgi:HPr kinase/phosphorylase
MSSFNKPHKKVLHITVGHFYANHAEKLGLRLEGSSRGLNRLIREPTINRPGLALSGFFSYFAVKRIQVLGAAELSYLKSLGVTTLKERARALFSRKMPCLVVARNAPIPPALLEAAAEFETPVLRTSMITMKFINAATILLETDFAPSTTEHGSMVSILGVGTLIRGASGIGKSECVLGLIERGYSLVSDDITRFRSVEGSELIGMSDSISRYHMEVRGIGIINIASIFGAGAVVPQKTLNFVVTLKDWHEVENVDRIGLDRETYEILGIKVPHVTLPVRTGRDIARLVEVAALDQKLKDMGENSAQEFNQRLLHMISERRSR